MLIQETWVNKTENHICGESEPYEPYTDNIGKLFLNLQREYGRCISKMHIDTPEGVKNIGWVFEKKTKYTDCDQTYLQETWVTLHKKPPTITTTAHYLYL